MRPSSSSSEPGPEPGAEPGLFDEIHARGPVRAAVSDRTWLAAMLAAESELAQAQAELGLLPPDAAAAITAACDPDRFDLAALGRAAAGPGNPVLPLVEALRAAVGEPHAGTVHAGATSQDILDTAAMLVARDAVAALLPDLRGAGEATARLAREHRETPMAGRTLLQYGMPTTFGRVAAGWAEALDTAGARLGELPGRVLAVQLGGAVGTQQAWGRDAPALVERYATRLGLAAPRLPWHTDRTRIAELAGALGLAAGAAGKVARDVTLLASSELGEVSEAAPGGSSAMPHKRNPVASVCAVACAMQAPGLVATLFAAMVQEHQRAAGAWHAEWRPLRELLTATGSAAAWLHQCLGHLNVHPEAMRENLTRLAASGGGPP